MFAHLQVEEVLQEGGAGSEGRVAAEGKHGGSWPRTALEAVPLAWATGPWGAAALWLEDGHRDAQAGPVGSFSLAGSLPGVGIERFHGGRALGVPITCQARDETGAPGAREQVTVLPARPLSPGCYLCAGCCNGHR